MEEIERLYELAVNSKICMNTVGHDLHVRIKNFYQACVECIAALTFLSVGEVNSEIARRLAAVGPNLA
jgi:hypothetical protein